MSDLHIESFFQRWHDSLNDGSFVKLVLAKYVGHEPGLLRVSIQPVLLKSGPALSFLTRYTTRDITKNYTVAESLNLVREWAGAHFHHLHFMTQTLDAQLRFSKKGKPWFHARTRRPDAPGPTPVSAAHNREKHRYLSLQRPFLSHLGITNARGELVASMARKWKQINKFIEVLDHALRSCALADQVHLRVWDFGAGKAYLTFALYDYLRHSLNREVDMTGVELRTDLVNDGNRLAKQIKYEGLHFSQGDVHDTPVDALDIMVALHACDTATDIAIYKGIQSGAKMIVCAPCCHRQIRPQLLSPHPLRPILQHGIHLGQQAEMVTDTLRALLLEACGYQTQVFEFISLEHTAKNKMILAVKRPTSTRSQTALAEVQAIKDFYGLKEHALEQLLSLK